MTTMSPTTKALLVMVLDERIRTFLMLNDPKALKQALCALKLVDDVPTGIHFQLNAVAEEVMAVSTAKPVKGNLVLVLGICDGLFYASNKALRSEKRNETCELNAGALARMLVKLGYDANNANHVLSHSSSVDFPQDEEGVPEGFTARKAHKILQEAILLSMKVR